MIDKKTFFQVLKAIQDSDIAKKEQKQWREYIKKERETKVYKCEYFDCNPNFPLTDNNCCCISGFLNTNCEVLLGEECTILKNRLKKRGKSCKRLKN